MLKQSETYQGEFAIDGRVTEINTASQTLQLVTDSATFVAPYDGATFPIVKDHLRQGGDGPSLRVEGIGELNRDDQLTHVDQITALEATWQRALDRLDESATLPAGWLDGEGEVVAPTAIDDARDLFLRLAESNCPQLRVFPTPEGGVQVEWTNGLCDIVVTFSENGPCALAVNTATGTNEELLELKDNPRNTGEVEHFIRENLEAALGGG
ncbi:MAG TPA: hypothetical protein VIK54_15780 [Acidimicrobiia bacterium]